MMNAAIHVALRVFGMIVLSDVSTIAMAAPSGPAEPVAAEKEAPIYCVDGIYRFLPGEFNFCMAGRDLQKGRYRSAREMLELAAGWGNKNAQYALGLMYFNGDHIAVDHPRGLAWLALAAERHDPTYEAVLISAYGKATVMERRRATELLAAMRPVYADAIAARRAQRHFDRAMREITGNEPYTSDTCIAGLTTGYIDQSHPICPPVSFAIKKLNTMGETYFRGWQGQVTVGPLQPLHRADDDGERGSPDQR